MSEIGVVAEGATSKAQRSAEVEPYLRGCAFPAGGGASYPRADPRSRDRLPADTWGTATIPVGVRLEFVGDASAVEISYVTQTDDLGYRGPGAGTTFALWRCVPSGEGREGTQVDEQDAVLGEGRVRLSCEAPLGPGERWVVYLPEGMKPTVVSLEAVTGSLSPAPSQPRWVCYGDSIAEGWTASAPAHAWPAVVGRALELDVVNMGYAGAARGEIVSAEQIATISDPVAISVAHGTNCWTRIPHSAGMAYEGTLAFLTMVRAGHPDVPIVVASPVLRPDAETTPNVLGASLGDLRSAMERAVCNTIDEGDLNLMLVPGRKIIGSEHLADGIHPNDEGHRRIAHAVGDAIDAMTRGR